MDWAIFWTIFSSWPFYRGESTPLVFREGWMQSISTEGGVGGKVLLVREGCETDYYYAGGWEMVG